MSALADDYDGAPVYGYVSDPAATSGPGIPMPRYTPSYIYCCPECAGDLQHEGVDGYWCACCRRAWYFTEVACYDETDYERD